MSHAVELEKNLNQLKQELSKVSEERWRATLSRNRSAEMNARKKAAEKTLENCRALAQYVENFSIPLARQITQREAQARKTFDIVQRTNDSKQFDAWVKQQLIPSTRFAERLGHLAASATMTPRGRPVTFHRWMEK